MNSRLLSIKAEVFPKNYLHSIVDADYSEFIDASLARFKKNPKKLSEFMYDLAKMFDKQYQSFASLNRKILLLRKFVERIEDKDRIIKGLSDMELFDKLIERYKESTDDYDSCMAIV